MCGGRWTSRRGTELYSTITDLEPDTEYRWAVRAENEDGRSAWVFGPNFTTLVEETDEAMEEDDGSEEEESESNEDVSEDFLHP